jgi:5-methylcytosine-specific restriction protein A
MAPRPAWVGSSRRSRLPADWPKRRRIVLDRDPLCRLAFADICTGRSTEVDHRHPGDDHSLGNLQGACAPCHRRKTLAEAAQARGAGPLKKRPTEPHPGITPGG